MTTFAKRRMRSIVLFALLVVLLLIIELLLNTSLHNTVKIFGWVLLGVLAFLTLFNLRKRFDFLPLGSSAVWLQLHAYVGLLSGIVFMIHVRWQFVQGFFEATLAVVFVLVFTSGLVGLVLSRFFARLLTTRSNEVLFERIPARQRDLKHQVEQLVLEGLSNCGSTALSQFYADRLQGFFSKNCHFWSHLLQSDRPRYALLSEMKAHERFLNPTEKQTMEQIIRCVEAKDDLDYQYALQATLKYWLFIHIPFSYGLWVLIVVHLFLVHAFSGGIE